MSRCRTPPGGGGGPPSTTQPGQPTTVVVQTTPNTVVTATGAGVKAVGQEQQAGQGEAEGEAEEEGDHHRPWSGQPRRAAHRRGLLEHPERTSPVERTRRTPAPICGARRRRPTDEPEEKHVPQQTQQHVTATQWQRRSSSSACVALLVAAAGSRKPGAGGRQRRRPRRHRRSTPRPGSSCERSSQRTQAPRARPRTVKVFPQFRSDFRPTTLLVLGEAKDAKGVRWLKLSLPMRPNGRKGWVKAAAVQMRPVRRSIVIDLSARKLRVLEGGRTRYATRVAIGRRGMETPTGATSTSRPRSSPRSASSARSHSRRAPTPSSPSGRAAASSASTARRCRRCSVRRCRTAAFACRTLRRSCSSGSLVRARRSRSSRRTPRSLGELEARFQRIGERTMRRARTDQERAGGIDAVCSREGEWQPGKRRAAPADRRAAGVGAHRHVDWPGHARRDLGGNEVEISLPSLPVSSRRRDAERRDRPPRGSPASRHGQSRQRLRTRRCAFGRDAECE